MGTVAKCPVHPLAWPAFLGSEKVDSLKYELGTDQHVQVQASGDHVAPEGRRAPGGPGQGRQQKFMHFLGKEGDLSLGCGFIVEVAVTNQPMAGHAPNLRLLHHVVPAWLATVVAEVVVAGGDEQANDPSVGRNGRAVKVHRQ